MPLMSFYCAKCARAFSRFRSLSQAPEGAPCPICKQKIQARKDAATSAAPADKSPKAS